jgi:hypothetical protein
MSSLGGSPPGPTAQQAALQRDQATTNANLNLEENEQRKVILNALQGTRVFRGSALSRSIAGNSAGVGTPQAPPGPSQAQQNAPIRAGVAGSSLLDTPGNEGATTIGPSVAAGQGATPGGRPGIAGGGGGGRGPMK